MNSFSPVWRVDLRVRPSRIFLSLTCLLHGGALLAVMQSGVALEGGTLLGLCLLISLFLSWRQEIAKAGFVVREQGPEWWLGAAEREGPATLLGRQIWRYLVVIDFQRSDEKRRWRQRVVVLPDAVPAEDFRRLRVRLRYGCSPDRAGRVAAELRNKPAGHQ